ncbi:PAS domain-containing sensor histidine kinase [Methanoculleus sediminis]|uniref:PAS domain-containing sensor histidine kinase n=1 Tax=Methanoculleus sediminis TaxID=1550566 RepID=UPI0009E21F55|nr:PAS domain S-box protein [Methanoculleus sediminis]
MRNRNGRRRTAPLLRRQVAALDRAGSLSSGSVTRDARMYAFLRRLGRTVRANRVCLAEVARKPGTGGICLRLRYEWADGAAVPKGKVGCLSCRDLPPGWEDQLRAGQPVRGISTPVIVIPIFCGPELQGILGLKGHTGRRRWRRLETGALEAVAATLGSVAICPCSCEALHAAEAYYHAIVEDLTDPLCRLLPDGTIIYANEAFCAFCRRERKDVLGMRAHEILPAEIAGELPVRAGPPDAFTPTLTREFRVGGADGEERWYRSVCRAIFDTGGAVCEYQVVGHDITERKRREARNTWMNDQKLALLADAASDAIVVMDGSARITYWNHSAEDLFGYAAGEIIGDDPGQLFPPGYSHLPYVKDIRHAVAGALQGAVRLRFPDVTFARKGGSVFLGELSIAAVRVGGGWYCVGIVRDTTVQRTREQALREERDRTDTLLRIAARLNCSIAQDAVLDALCEETARALQVPAAVVFLSDRHRGMLVPARSFGVPEGAQGCLPCIPLSIYERELHKQGPIITVPDLMLRVDEMSRKSIPERPPRAVASAAILYEGVLIGALDVVMFDAPRTFSPGDLAFLKGIADQAALAIVNARHFEERKAYERRLQMSLDEKTALLKEVHHRVKNNMQVISSLLSLQGRLIDNPEARESIRESVNRVKSLALVHESLYRSESLAAVDIGAYAHRLADDLVQSYALQAYVSVTVETAEMITFSGDAAIPLGLILNELISNSLRHGFAGRDNGAIVIRISRLPDDRLAIEYRDDGVGMPPDVINRPPATLGLQLVRILAAQLEGTITFRPGVAGTVVELIVSDGAGGPEEDACTA